MGAVEHRDGITSRVRECTEPPEFSWPVALAAERALEYADRVVYEQSLRSDVGNDHRPARQPPGGAYR